MSKLSPEGLDRIRRMAATQNHAYVDSLLAHIAALEEERDAALAHVARLDADYLHAQKEISSVSADLAAAIADNAALLERGTRLYDLAQHDEACRMLVGDDLSVCDCAMGEWHQVQRDAHPGAALLEEHRKALETEKVRLGNVLARLSEEVEHFSGNPCAAALSSILSGIERVAVRARSEGLEKAAAMFDGFAAEAVAAAARVSDDRRAGFWMARDKMQQYARKIRDLKEPEP